MGGDGRVMGQRAQISSLATNMHKVSSARGRSSLTTFSYGLFFMLLWPGSSASVLVLLTRLRGGAALGIVILEVRAVTSYPTLSSP